MPSPQAKLLHGSTLRQELLQRMVQRTTNAQRLVKRAQIILEGSRGPVIAALLSNCRSIMKRCAAFVIAGMQRSLVCRPSCEIGKRKLLSQASAAYYSKSGSPTPDMQVASGFSVGSSRKARNILVAQELRPTTPCPVPGNRKK